MAEKQLPCTNETLIDICSRFPTPFHLYDEKGIVDNMNNLKSFFSWAEGFTEFFAVKAAPNPFLMTVLKNLGAGADCSSMAELLLAEKCGITGEQIMFSSNDTPAYEFQKARELGAIINLDDITHIPFLEKTCGIPEVISVRYNPGKLRGGSFIMGNPEEVKFGFTREQVFTGLSQLREKGAKRFGVHTFIASNELNPDYFVDTADMLYDLALEIMELLNIRLEFINISGGIGIPQKPDEKKVDLMYTGEKIHKKYNKKIKGTSLDPLSLFMECGRAITGPYGYLVSRVLHKKEIYKTHIGLDANMAHLMRPGMYGAYHHITVAGKEDWKQDQLYDITGSLCETNDRFAIDRQLPEIEVGDLIVLHDTGAHGHSMGFNYNGKLRSSELLLRESGEVIEIRRAETVDDYFATLDFNKLVDFKA